MEPLSSFDLRPEGRNSSLLCVSEYTLQVENCNPKKCLTLLLSLLKHHRHHHGRHQHHHLGHLPLPPLLDAARTPGVVWQERLAQLPSKSTASGDGFNKKISCKLSETVMRMMTDLMLFQRRTRNLSPCSSAVMVKRGWRSTRRRPTPASVYLVWL